MHLTWVTGDPVIQLNFPNPLNTSVQVGDVAYFSNPTAVGGVGNPSSQLHLTYQILKMELL